MTTASPDVVREIQQRVNLAGVRLVRGQCALIEAPPVPPAEWELDLNARIGGRKAPTGDALILVIAGLDVVARPARPGSAEKAPNAATFSCDFGLDYKIADEAFYAKLKDADVLHFGARNGMYNAWPYLRAHVQALASSMMLPIVLPTLRLDMMFPDLTKAVEKAIQTSK